ncbi:MAG TPA: sodium:proton exchanger [Prevotella sp.]|nr:sodium:proton exchanger [Prevotella sp.]
MDILLFSFAPKIMWAQVLLLIAGIVVVLKGADWLTNGAVGLATKLGISQIVIGLTIVAIGTSMPEFFVSVVSAIKGTPDLAVGNIIGSNIFNVLLIVGVAAIVSPISIQRTTVRRDIPIAIVASIMLMVMMLDGTVSRMDALVLFVTFIAFIWITLRGSKNGLQEVSPKKVMGTAKSIFFILIGLVGLVLGSNIFVDNASSLAHGWGISDAVIGLTIVAGGTSLPELATSAVAARKGDSGIAIGNVLGSNVFNILMILGLTGLISPMNVQGITCVDMAVMVISMALFWLLSFTKLRIERWEGGALIACFLGYIAWLMINV